MKDTAVVADLPHTIPVAVREPAPNAMRFSAAGLSGSVCARS
jgi:hypothetical protein